MKKAEGEVIKREEEIIEKEFKIAAGFTTDDGVNGDAKLHTYHHFTESRIWWLSMSDVILFS